MKNKKKQHQQQTKVTKKEDRKTEILSTIKKLNGATMALNHIVQIYPEEVKASKKIISLNRDKITLINAVQSIAEQEVAVQQQINRLAEERFHLPAIKFIKRHKLTEQINNEKALLEGLSHSHTLRSAQVLDISERMRKIVNQHEFAGDPNLLLRKYYTFVTYFYNPEIEKLNSLMGTTFPTKDPHKLSTTPLFAITEEHQAQKLLSIQDEIEM